MRVLFWTLPWQWSPPAERPERAAKPLATAPVPRTDDAEAAETLQQPVLPWCFDAQLW